jgi:hypothetical protein
MAIDKIPPVGLDTGAPTWDSSGNLAVSGNFTLTGNASGVIKSGTAVASTSGTNIDFTGIPSTAKRITVMFSGVSTSGTSNPLVQIGAGSITSSGYSATSSTVGSSAVSTTTYTTGFGVQSGNAANVLTGNIQLCLQTGNTWVTSGILGVPGQPHTNLVSGFIALSGTLDRVRITTVNGTDTFDAGTINVLWE